MKDVSGGTDEDEPSRVSGNGGLTRITVNLTRKAVEALESLSESTGYSKTDTINRALQVYAIVSGYQDKDGGLVIKPENAASAIKLHIL